MNFERYVPAITSYLDPTNDSICKAWEEIVAIFFRMNNDAYMSEHADLASAFDNLTFPNYLRVEVETIDKYFESFKISPKTLSDEEFIENKDFIKDAQSMRISFNTLRTLVFIKGTRKLMNAFRMVDNIYQIYLRYKLEMVGRSKNPTCWALVERISEFTSLMSPQNDEKNPIMKEQPKVYIIIKGSYKAINAKLKKNKTDHEKLDNPKYAIEPSTPIYQGTTSIVDDEIHAVLSFINEQRLTPYKQTYNKQHIKLSKSHILIDCSQKFYTIEHLKKDIDYVRNCIQLGIVTHKQNQTVKKYIKQTKTNPNVVNIDIFDKTNGKHIDEKEIIPLSKPWIDSDIMILTNKISEMKVETPSNDNNLEHMEIDDVDDQQTVFNDDRKSEIESVHQLDTIKEEPAKKPKKSSTRSTGGTKRTRL